MRRLADLQSTGKSTHETEGVVENLVIREGSVATLPERLNKISLGLPPTDTYLVSNNPDTRDYQALKPPAIMS